MSGGFGAPAGPFPQQPQQPGQPGLVQAGQGGFGQGTPFSPPPGFQSPYANYGFDPGFQSYLDNQYLGSMTDAGVNYQYDPTNQTFTGGTMTGRYSPIPLNVMQQAAGGDRSVLAPYFQSRFPQQPGPVPTVKPGTFNPFDRPGQPPPFPRFGGNKMRDDRDDRKEDRYNSIGRPNVVQPGPNVMPQTQPQGPQQRGLGGLQLNKFRNRLDQR